MVDEAFGTDIPAWRRQDFIRTAEYFPESALVGQARVWQSNGHAVPEDSMYVWRRLNLVSDVEVEATSTLRSEQTRDTIREYIESRRNRSISDEERFEMRAAFGEGERVVDILTGQMYTT